MSDRGGFLQRHTEKLKLVGFFLVMIVVSGQLFQTLGQAWKSSVLMRPLIRSLAPIASINLEEFTMFWLGVYLGLLVLLTYDPKKRLQGALLWLGTITAVLALSQIGLLLPNLEPTQSYGWALAGLLGGVLLGGGRKLTNVNTPEPMEFRRAGQIMFYILSLVTVVGFLEFHIDMNQVLRVTRDGLVIQSLALDPSFNSSNLIRNTVSAGIFLYTLNRFIEYDAESELFLLGPSGSGKSLFLVGMFKQSMKQLEDNEETPAEPPTAGLQRLVEGFSARSQDAGWGLEATQDVTDELRFGFVAGSLFPKNITISSTDYAGEDLERLPEALASDENEIDDQTIRELKRRVESADTLVYIVDCNRFVNNEPLGIDPYFEILRAASNKEAIVVATKADLLAEQFTEERGIEPFMYFDEFVEFVNEKLRTDDSVKALLQTTGATAYPVYYQTREEEDGSREPMRDPDGSANPVGFDELIDTLG